MEGWILGVEGLGGCDVVGLVLYVFVFYRGGFFIFVVYFCAWVRYD